MYHHVQKAPWYLLLIVIGVGQIVFAAILPVTNVIRLVLGVSSGVLLLLSLAFKQMTVFEENEELAVQFGPLPILRRRLPFSEMESVARGRTTILDGWGVHLSPRGGWTWNIWGRDCVTVRLRGNRIIHIGTDDPEGLEAFLKSRLGNARHVTVAAD